MGPPHHVPNLSLVAAAAMPLGWEGGVEQPHPAVLTDIEPQEQCRVGQVVPGSSSSEGLRSLQAQKATRRAPWAPHHPPTLSPLCTAPRSTGPHSRRARLAARPSRTSLPHPCEGLGLLVRSARKGQGVLVLRLGSAPACASDQGHGRGPGVPWGWASSPLTAQG